MNQHKPNKVLWYSLALAVLLCVASLVGATGTTLARYRLEREAELNFEVRPPEQLMLGSVRAATAEDVTETVKVGDPIFDARQNPQWENVNGVIRMTPAVANGISETDFSARDQKLTLRLVGTIGLTTQQPEAEDPEAAAATETAPEPEALAIYLVLPGAGENGADLKLKAEQSQILPGTPLYTNMGEGWVFTFRTEDGEEPYWILSGGSFNYVTMTLIMEGTEATEDANLQLQVMAEVSRK